MGLAASAGTEPNALGAPLLNEGGAAGEDERTAFWSLAVPKATAHSNFDQLVVLRRGERKEKKNVPSDSAPLRIASTLD